MPSAPDLPKSKIEDSVQEAAQLLDRDATGPARELLDSILAQAPQEPEALRLRGRVAQQLGENEEAISWFKSCLGLAPESAENRCDLARALADSGDWHGAIHHVLRAKSAAPGNPRPHLMAGQLFLQRGDAKAAQSHLNSALRAAPSDADVKLAVADILIASGNRPAAVPCLRQALALRPSDLDLQVRLAVHLQGLGRDGEALVLYDELLKQHPNNLAGLVNRANCLREMGDPGNAETALRRALQVRPGFPLAQRNLGLVLDQRGRAQEAVQLLRPYARDNPEDLMVRAALGHALAAQKQLGEALEHLEYVAEHKPDDAEAWTNLGGQRMHAGDYDGAEQAFLKAIALDDSHVLARNNLGVTMLLSCRIEDAAHWFRESLRVAPHFPGAASNLLYALVCSDQVDAASLAAQHLELGKLYAPQGAAVAQALPKARTGAIRVGVVSPDLRTHSVAFFLLPLMRGFDREHLEIYCYATTAQADAVTEEIKQLCSAWRLLAPADPNEIARAVRDDQVDILVDLSGHTSGTSLGIFPGRPALRQATWLGYPNTTGVPGVDFRISDAVADPAPDAAARHSEQLLRLPGGFLCYEPPAVAPEVGEPPVLRNGHLTFGSFNNLVKASPSTIRLWAQVLAEIPDSRMYIKAIQLNHPATADRIRHGFEAYGIDPERLTLEARTPSVAEHLGRYAGVDIALDTFPYNGTTTTCEALWMGVPVLSPLGEDHRARVTASILIHAGLPELVCEGSDDVLRMAKTYAATPAKLGELRHSLRQRLATSDLLNRDRFCADMQHAFERMLEGDDAAAPT